MISLLPIFCSHSGSTSRQRFQGPILGSHIFVKPPFRLYQGNISMYHQSNFPFKPPFTCNICILEQSLLSLRCFLLLKECLSQAKQPRATSGFSVAQISEEAFAVQNTLLIYEQLAYLYVIMSVCMRNRCFACPQFVCLALFTSLNVTSHLSPFNFCRPSPTPR